MAKGSVSMLEQETVFLFNRAEDKADIYTFEPSLKKKLDKMCEQYPEVCVKREDNGIGGVTYNLPKNLISVRTPRAKKDLTEEQKEELRTRFEKNMSK